ncbi:MAG: hypothetical protein IKW96_03125 [Ruminococcus sp.]|uniref:hypothetical protein n=1 Tax=Ruminococcus sp. TaxID=41978 RepID=UPI0025F67FF1|nr:hypothetical protein [Ruminococcus sp.]MBR5682263.1 hypothetical protein [Ruminococcus sp.]
MLRITLLITFLIAVPFAVPFIVIGLVKQSDKQKSAQNGGNPPQAQQKQIKKHDMTVSNVLFLIGTIFVVLSGLAFGVASWVHTTHTGRAAIIAAAAAVSYILSAVIGKFLKLSGTSISFYMLGTGFTATTLLTAGYYKLMGEWLSFSGGGLYALLALAAVTTTILLLTGFAVFKKNGLVYAALSTAAYSVFCVVFQFCSTFESKGMAFIIISSVILALLYGTKTFNGRKFELPFRITGSVTAFVFGSVSVLYVFSSLRHPTASSFIIVALIIAQLVIYGVKYQNIVLIASESISAILLAYMITMSVLETADDRYGIVIFAVLSVIIYLAHRFTKLLNNIATESITLANMVSSAFIAIFSVTKAHFVPEIIIGLAVSALITVYVFHKNIIVQRIAGIAAPLFACCNAFSAMKIMPSGMKHSDSIVASVFISVILAATALFIFLPKIAFNFHAKHPRRSDAILYANLVATGIFLYEMAMYDTLFIITLLLCIIHFALSNRVKSNITALIPSISVIITVYEALSRICGRDSLQFVLGLMALAIAYMAISRFVYHDGIFTKKNDKFILDPMIMTVWLAIGCMYQPVRMNAFFALIATAVYAASFIKKNTSRPMAAILLTVSSVLAAAALMTRPYLVPDSKAVSSKINIAIIALLGIACRYIWREFKNASRFASESIFITSIAALLFDTLYFDTAANTIFSMSVMLVILIISISTRSKTWFAAASISLFTITVYATREYLMALNWWIYLFIAGIILIGIAAGNEYCKKNNETIKSSVVKKFSGWTW